MMFWISACRCISISSTNCVCRAFFLFLITSTAPPVNSWGIRARRIPCYPSSANVPKTFLSFPTIHGDGRKNKKKVAKPSVWKGTTTACRISSSDDIDLEGQNACDARQHNKEEVVPFLWGKNARIVEYNTTNDNFAEDGNDFQKGTNNGSASSTGIYRTVIEYEGFDRTHVRAYVVASNKEIITESFSCSGGDNRNITGDEEENFDNTNNHGGAVGVLFLSDVYGAFSDDTKYLAEKIVRELSSSSSQKNPVVVMVPDVFRGKPWRADDDLSSSGVVVNSANETYEEWRGCHPDLRVSIDTRAAAACLRERFGSSSLFVWGTCYGGGRALEVAAGVYPTANNSRHDPPPPVDPAVVVAWYPTRYNASNLFGKNRRAREQRGDDRTTTGATTSTKKTEENCRTCSRSFAIITVIAGKDTIPGATPRDARALEALLEEDERVKDFVVKTFPGENHGFAHIGLSSKRKKQQETGGGTDNIDDTTVEECFLLSTSFILKQQPR